MPFIWSHQPFIVWNDQNRKATFWSVSFLARSLFQFLLTIIHYTLIWEGKKRGQRDLCTLIDDKAVGEGREKGRVAC